MEYPDNEDYLYKEPEKWQYYHLRRQHLVFIISLSLLFAGVIIHLYHNHLRVNPSLEISIKQIEQPALKVNPNIAPWQELALLPGIGTAKANAIVSFRENQLKRFSSTNLENSSISIFKSPQDLNLVPGIGEKTIENISEYLLFE